MIHVVTDSCSDLTRETARDLGVTVVPLTVRFGPEEFKDGVDLDTTGFYERLQASTTNPTTSQPSPPEFGAVYSQLLADPADSIVSIHISHKLSGTLQSASLAAADHGDRIAVVDSETATAGEGLLVRVAVEAAAAGKDLAAVVAAVEAARSRQRLYGLVDTLEYLIRGGRVGRARGVIGGMLNVKPLIGVEDGEVVSVGRARKSTGVSALLAKVEADLPAERIIVMHGSAPEACHEVHRRLSEKAPGVDILEGEIGPVIGTYAGPGVVGVALIRQA